MPESSDSDFSWGEYVRRNNDELVATFGNLVHRVLTQVHRNFDGSVPDAGSPRPEDRELAAKAQAALDAVAASLEGARFREALGHAMGLARDANRYIDAQAPWRQMREDRAAAGQTLHAAMVVLAALKVALYPFLPFSAQRLHELLGLSGKVEDDEWAIRPPVSGTPIPEPAPLFTKLDDSVASQMASMLG